MYHIHTPLTSLVFEVRLSCMKKRVCPPKIMWAVWDQDGVYYAGGYKSKQEAEIASWGYRFVNGRTIRAYELMTRAEEAEVRS